MRCRQLLPRRSHSGARAHSVWVVASVAPELHIFSNVTQSACVALGVGTSAKER
jgi:hypothetical protein